MNLPQGLCPRPCWKAYSINQSISMSPGRTGFLGLSAASAAVEAARWACRTEASVSSVVCAGRDGAPARWRRRTPVTRRRRRADTSTSRRRSLWCTTREASTSWRPSTGSWSLERSAGRWPVRSVGQSTRRWSAGRWRREPDWRRRWSRRTPRTGWRRACSARRSGSGSSRSRGAERSGFQDTERLLTAAPPSATHFHTSFQLLFHRYCYFWPTSTKAQAWKLD